MSIKIINRDAFLEIKNKITLNEDENIDNIFNKLFSNNTWRKIYKSVIFKNEMDANEKKENEIKALLNKISDKNYLEIKKKNFCIK